MKPTTSIVVLTSMAVVLGALALGCSTPHKSSAADLQGTWTGREIGATPEAPRRLVISGNLLEYRGAIPNDWGKGTFTVQENTQPRQMTVSLTECGFSQYVGKTSCMIYKIEGGTLTFAGNEPGNPEMPASFDAPGARRMVFTKQ